MAAGLLIIPNYMPAEDANGDRIPGALLYSYANGTTTPKTTYTNAGLTIPHANPVVADASGVFPAIYADNDSLNLFTVTVTTAGGAPLITYDDVRAGVPISYVEQPVSAYIATLLDDVDASAARTTLGAAATADLAAVYLDGGSVSAAAQLDITLPAGYRAFRLMLLDFVPVTNAVSLWLRLNLGSGILSGASDYMWNTLYSSSSSSTITSSSSTPFDAADNQIILSGGVNYPNTVAPSLFDVIINTPISPSTDQTAVRWEGDFFAATDSLIRGRGRVPASTTRATVARVMFGSGNIASGRWALHGIRGF